MCFWQIVTFFKLFIYDTIYKQGVGNLMNIDYFRRYFHNILSDHLFSRWHFVAFGLYKMAVINRDFPSDTCLGKERGKKAWDENLSFLQFFQCFGFLLSCFLKKIEELDDLLMSRNNETLPDHTLRIEVWKVVGMAHHVVLLGIRIPLKWKFHC